MIFNPKPGLRAGPVFSLCSSAVAKNDNCSNLLYF